MSAVRVIHTAQALVDQVAQVPTLPARGQNVMASAVTRYAASAVNILLAAARSGAECVHAGAVGTGPNADLVRAALQDEGVLISSPPVPDADTGICFVMVEPSAERTFVTTLGAERLVTAASLATSAPTRGDFVCVSGYSLVGTTRDPVLDFLRDLPSEVEVVLDPGAIFARLPAPLRDEVLDLTSLWTSNVEEATQLTGWSGMGDTVLAVAGRLRRGAVAIVRDGPKGCAVRADGHTASVAGYPQTAVDTNGAGDCHTGILVACRATGMAWDAAARRANAGAAIKVTRHGPASSPTSAEIDAFLAAHPG